MKNAAPVLGMAHTVSLSNLSVGTLPMPLQVSTLNKRNSENFDAEPFKQDFNTNNVSPNSSSSSAHSEKIDVQETIKINNSDDSYFFR